MHPVRRQISRRASSLRRDRSDAEAIIWTSLRNRLLHGFKFRFQASIGPFVVDFLCIEVIRLGLIARMSEQKKILTQPPPMKMGEG